MTVDIDRHDLAEGSEPAAQQHICNSEIFQQHSSNKPQMFSIPKNLPSR